MKLVLPLVAKYLNISRRTYSTDLLIRTWFSPQVGKEGSPFRGGPDLGPRWNSKYDYEECDKLNNESLSSLGQRGGWLINESGLYSLVLSSKLPGAKQFKRWVTSEVLPSIRNNGGYINGQETMSPEELMAKALMVAEKTLAEREKRISALTVENQILQPKADYFDQLVDRNLLTSLRDTAKELGIKEKKFIGFLVEKKYLYRDKKGKLTPYAGKADDLFTVKECFNEKTNWSGTQTMVTPKGRETFKLLCEGL